MLKFASLIAIVLMTIVLCSNYSGNNMALANLKPVPDLKQLYLIADKLDKGLLDENVRTEPGFGQRVFDFVSLPKGEVTKSILDNLNAILVKFQVQVKEYVNFYKPNNVNIFNMFDGKYNRAKTTAQAVDGLAKLIDEYKARLDLKLEVKDADISCDLDTLQLTKLHEILYVLQKDIVYLASEKQSVIVRAIANQIKEANYYAKHEQYNNEGATDKQKELMRDLYFSAVLADKKTTQDAVQHFEYPNPLVLGRLADDCSSFMDFVEHYEAMEKQRAEDCKNSDMAKDNKRHPIISSLEEEFGNEKNFCEKFLSARAPAPSR